MSTKERIEKMLKKSEVILQAGRKETRMKKHIRDEELLKQVCEEMGIEWVKEAGYITIDNIPAKEWLKTHNLFEV